MNDNLTGRITEFKSATEGTGIAIYEALGSSNLKDAVAKASGWMTQLTKATEKGGLSGLAEEAGTVVSEVAVTVAISCLVWCRVVFPSYSLWFLASTRTGAALHRALCLD